VDQLRAFRSYIGQLGDARSAYLSLEAEIPLLHVRCAQVALERECPVGDEAREIGREWVFESDWKLGGGNKKLRVEIRRVEIEPLAGGQRRLIVVDAVPGADDPLACGGRHPGDPQARGEVVFVCVVAGARNAILPDRHDRMGGRIVDTGAIL